MAFLQAPVFLGRLNKLDNIRKRMPYIVSETDFKTVFRFWRNCLWPHRREPIEPTSALLFKKGIDMDYQSAEVFFKKIELKGLIVGVCSGQRTSFKEFRSRGLWVSPRFRRKKIGTKLFQSIEKEAQKRDGSRLWTLARYSSKHFYLSMEMKESGRTSEFEYGPHFWMFKRI